MRFSDDRLSHLAHVILEGLSKDRLISYSRKEIALQATKDALFQFFHIEDDVDTRVIQKIRSQRRNIVEGSPEWDILYQKYFAEEWAKLGR